jgi:hypothetical protein
MTFHVCAIDGTKLGEFSEAEFQEKVSSGELRPQDYYWHEGMADWKPISEYRTLAKTQRISFAPPTRPTVKIQMEPESQPGRTQSAFARLLNRFSNSFKAKSTTKSKK